MRILILSYLSFFAATAAATPELKLDLSAPLQEMTPGRELTEHSESLSHYGPPPTGCEKDEKAFQIQGIPGGICAAKCTDFLPCPTDLPDGVTAVPQCALQDQNGMHYCVLVCQTEDSNNLRGGLRDEQCGDATCQPVEGQGVGICTYS